MVITSSSIASILRQTPTWVCTNCTSSQCLPFARKVTGSPHACSWHANSTLVAHPSFLRLLPLMLLLPLRPPPPCCCCCCRWFAVHSKSKVLEVQLQQETYTPDTLPALRRVAELLDQEEVGLRAALEAVGSQLRAYEGCGPDFEELVQEYMAIKVRMGYVGLVSWVRMQLVRAGLLLEAVWCAWLGTAALLVHLACMLHDTQSKMYTTYQAVCRQQLLYPACCHCP